jgi:uncharacterized tellurite resistance protein B-like protein
MTILTEEQQIHSFDEVKTVLANQERFKIKLGIGSDAFASLKVGKFVGQLWDMGGAVGTGASLAASKSVAGIFFGSFWTTLPFTAAAITPVGWVVGAAVVSGGAYYGVSRLFKSYAGSRMDEVPKFLNTGLDVLAASALDLLGSLALKVAAIDGHIDASERAAMEEYFVEEWGYAPDYVQHALDVLQQNVDKSRLSEMANSLAEFSRQNPDCNFQAIQAELRKLLTEIAEADGHLDEREEMAIERIENSLRERNSLISSTGRVFSEAASGMGNAAASTARTVGKSTSTALLGAADTAARARKVTAGYIGAKIWPRK